MKLRDLLSEYGMQPGPPTPSGQQHHGNIIQKSDPSPTQQQSDSPSTDPNAQPAQQDSDQQPDIRDLEQGATISSEDGRELEITSAFGNNSGAQGDSANVVVATDKQSGEQFIIDPDKMQESSRTLKFITSREKQLRETRQRYKAAKRKLRNLRRQAQLGAEPLLEVDFNNRQLIQQALNASISCGFEAETVWELVNDPEDGVDVSWADINASISPRQEEAIMDDYREWLTNHNDFDTARMEAQNDWIDEYRDDDTYLEDFVRERGLESEVEEHKEMLLDDDPETYEEYDESDWNREFVNTEYMDEFTEWLLEQAQDQGIGWDEAMDHMESEHSVDDWIWNEYDSDYFEFMRHWGIEMSQMSLGGLDEIGGEFSRWTTKNSKFNGVQVGDYHSGVSTTQDYWRVEPDASISADSGVGAEIISPVYSTPAQMLQEMQSLFDYITDQPIQTNESTGLHITMSMSEKQSRSQPNYLKMALLLGDTYLLKQFDRLDNMYTKSQLLAVKQKAKQLAHSLEYNAKDLEQLERILQVGVSMDKFRSINFKNVTNDAGNQLIEFRIAGNQNYQSSMDLITRTVSRYAIIMQAGYDDQAFYKDYIKAIYKVLNSVAPSVNWPANMPDTALTQAVQSLTPVIKDRDTWDTIMSHLGKLYNVSVTENSAIDFLRAERKNSNTPAFFSVIAQVLRAISEQPDIKIPVRASLAFRKSFQEAGHTLDDFIKWLVARSRSLGFDQEIIDLRIEALRKLLAKNDISLKPEHEPATIEWDIRRVRYLASREWVSQLGNVPVDSIKVEGNLIAVGRDEYSQAAHALEGLQQPNLDPEKKEIFQKVLDQFNNKYEINLVRVGEPSEIPDNQAYVPLTVPQLEQAGFVVIKINESVDFESLPLVEQLKIVRKLDETKLAKRHAKAWQKLQEHRLVESVPEVSSNTELKRILSKPLLAGDLKAQMKAYIALPVPAMLKTFRELRATQGDDHDLRDVVKQYVRAYKPDPHTHKLHEGVSKDDIVKAIQDMDPKNEVHLDLLNRIYKIVHSGVIGQNIDRAFATTLDGENMSSAEIEQVKVDMTRIIGNLDADFDALEKFVERMEKQGGVVNVKELTKPLTTLDAILGDEIALKAFFALANYGVGRKQKGPGEYALACLSNKIKLAAEEGDLEIEGIGKVELKAALSVSGGRIGYGGDTQDIRRGIIDKYAEQIPTVMAQIGARGGSLGLPKFIAGLNQDLPINNPENQRLRKQIVMDLLKRDMGQFANKIADKIATSEDIVEIENTYLVQNFLWYKDRDDFDALLLMHMPNRKSAMIRNENELIAFRRSGHAAATSIGIIPTQAGAGREQWAQLTLNKQGL